MYFAHTNRTEKGSNKLLTCTTCFNCKISSLKPLICSRKNFEVKMYNPVFKRLKTKNVLKGIYGLKWKARKCLIFKNLQRLLKCWKWKRAICVLILRPFWFCVCFSYRLNKLTSPFCFNKKPAELFCRLPVDEQWRCRRNSVYCGYDSHQNQCNQFNTILSMI